jgi:hypothetical protein
MHAAEKRVCCPQQRHQRRVEEQRAGIRGQELLQRQIFCQRERRRLHVLQSSTTIGEGSHYRR